MHSHPKIILLRLFKNVRLSVVRYFSAMLLVFGCVYIHKMDFEWLHWLTETNNNNNACHFVLPFAAVWTIILLTF